LVNKALPQPNRLPQAVRSGAGLERQSRYRRSGESDVLLQVVLDLYQVRERVAQGLLLLGILLGGLCHGAVHVVVGTGLCCFLPAVVGDAPLNAQVGVARFPGLRVEDAMDFHPTGYFVVADVLDAIGGLFANFFQVRHLRATEGWGEMMVRMYEYKQAVSSSNVNQTHLENYTDRGESARCTRVRH
jgi:hypothetical protein